MKVITKEIDTLDRVAEVTKRFPIGSVVWTMDQNAPTEVLLTHFNISHEQGGIKLSATRDYEYNLPFFASTREELCDMVFGLGDKGSRRRAIAIHFQADDREIDNSEEYANEFYVFSQRIEVVNSRSAMRTEDVAPEGPNIGSFTKMIGSEYYFRRV